MAALAAVALSPLYIYHIYAGQKFYILLQNFHLCAFSISSVCYRVVAAYSYNYNYIFFVFTRNSEYGSRISSRLSGIIIIAFVWEPDCHLWFALLLQEERSCSEQASEGGVVHSSSVYPQGIATPTLTTNPPCSQNATPTPTSLPLNSQTATPTLTTNPNHSRKAMPTPRTGPTPKPARGSSQHRMGF